MKNSKPLIFTIIFFTVTIALIIYRYEKLLVQVRQETHFDSVAGGLPSSRKYTAAEIVEIIKNSKEYLGDTISIFDNGQINSSNGKFQGTINAVISSKDNMDLVRGSMETNKLPIQYNIYALASVYYLQQYPAEGKKAK
jgi:hypothetical protein